MKATIFTIVPLLFLFVGSVLASPVAVSTADEQDLAARQFIELDLIVNVLYSDVQVTNKFYNTTCAEKCSPVYVVSLPSSPSPLLPSQPWSLEAAGN